MTEEDAYCKGYNQGYTKGFEQGKEFQEQKDISEFLEDLKKVGDLIFDRTDYYTTLELKKLMKKWEGRKK